MSLTIREETINDQTIKTITYESPHQKITLISMGATIKRWETKDKNNTFENIVISYQNAQDYLHNTKLLGATIGPYAGRIYPAKLKLDAHVYRLSQNFNKRANLHSGADNLTNVNFSVERLDEQTVMMATENPYKTKEFPSGMHFKVFFTFTKDSLKISYETHSEKTGIANLTNHTYFNLSGNLKTDILNHTLKIPALKYVKLDRDFIAQAIKSTQNTPFDFSKEKHIKEAVLPLKKTPQKGLDHPFLLTEGPVVLKDQQSGRWLQIKTDYDAVVIYSNNFLSHHLFEGDQKDRPHLGICFETQHIPNDIHFSKNIKSLIKPGKIQRRSTTYTINH